MTDLGQQVLEVLEMAQQAHKALGRAKPEEATMHLTELREYLDALSLTEVKAGDVQKSESIETAATEQQAASGHGQPREQAAEDQPVKQEQGDQVPGQHCAPDAETKTDQQNSQDPDQDH